MENKAYKDSAARILLECADLLEKKSQDYNSGPVSRDDYALYGRRSHMQMVWTKVLRLRSLSSSEGTVNFESVEDTLKDLCNYSAIWADWERRNHASDE